MRTRPAFSLVEVVAALGLVAVTVVALLGLFAASLRAPAEIADARIAAKMSGCIQEELERLRAEAGLDRLAASIPPAGSTAPRRLVAPRTGRIALCADGAAPAADRALDDPVQAGIALRDRFFLVEMWQSPDVPYLANEGYLLVSALVAWPYRLPTGPATPGVSRCDADPWREVPPVERRTLKLNFALRP